MKLPHAFSPAVMAELARPVASFDPRNAELVEGLAPAWHVVECYSSREREVAKELAKRRFGIYLPLERETIVRRGRKVDVQTLMFPGYVFVFTWLTDTNFTRIASTPGVHQFLMKEDGGR
jgi:transcription antitermination factor NusG